MHGIPHKIDTDGLCDVAARYLREGDIKSAIDCLELALEEDPQHARAAKDLAALRANLPSETGASRT